MLDPMSDDEARPQARRCGPCSLCCSVLRVDELAKPAGIPCENLQAGAGCGIHPSRPEICRSYRCAWLEGRFEEPDRPDRLGALVDFLPRGGGLELVIVEARPDAFERSPRLQAIADAHRETLTVRVSDTLAVEDPDRPYRLLLAGGVEHRVRGERVTVLQDRVAVGEIRLPWLERRIRRLAIAWRRWRISRLRRRAAD